MSKPQILIQTVLRTPAKVQEGYLETVCWLPQDRRVKVGTIITLEGDTKEIRWKVRHQGERMKLCEINRRWNVGGL